MPLHCIRHQLRVMAIKLKGLLPELRPGGKFAPGKGKGQDYIDYNVGGLSHAEKGWIFKPST